VTLTLNDRPITTAPGQIPISMTIDTRMLMAMCHSVNVASITRRRAGPAVHSAIIRAGQRYLSSSTRMLPMRAATTMTTSNRAG
jgi:hypothetical protein